MRVLHLLSQLELTGAESYAITVAEKQIDMGYIVYIMSDSINMRTRADYIKLELHKRDFINRFNHIKFITDFIKRHKIDIVHSHSRASSWSGHISARLAGIPHITSVHQILPGGFTKKLLPCLGDICLANCENVRKITAINYSFPINKIIVVKNPFDIEFFSLSFPDTSRLKIAIVGRYSGPKGRAMIWFLKDVISKIEEELESFEILIVGKKVDEISNMIDNLSKSYKHCRVRQTGFIGDIRDILKETNIVIGGGRVAIEAVLSGRCVLALGEKGFLGLLTTNRLEEMEKSSFGDCLFNNEFDVEFAKKETLFAIKNCNDIIRNQEGLVQKVREYHNSEKIVSDINKFYEFLIYSKKRCLK
ncbi:MAG: glycosyltransferase [bacterium]